MNAHLLPVAALTLLALASPAETPPPAPAVCLGADQRSFTLAAWAYDRGNVETFTDRWADAAPMIAFGGNSPAWVEFDLELPLEAEWTLDVQYAAATPRPLDLQLNRKAEGPVCRTANGSWQTSRAVWEATALGPRPAGPLTLRLSREGDFPHVVALRWVADRPLPAGWTPSRPGARTRPGGASAPDLGAAFTALGLALDTLTARYGDGYPQGAAHRAALEALVRAHAAGEEVADRLAALRRAALLDHPRLATDLLLVRRPAQSPSLGLPRNWQGNGSLPRRGYDDALCVWSPRAPDQPPRELYRPGNRFLGDVDLHWEADRVLFSMPDERGRWQIWEWSLAADAPPVALTGQEPDVDHYDPCYLPDGRIVFGSTAGFIGVPCVNGASEVANLFVMDGDGRHPRRLCFDQEHNWCPTVMNDGRVLYTRWEYADTPHSNTRLLFTMNPDGTGQAAYLGSNSYWPNAYFYARPLPDHPTRVVAVIGGHHDHPRMGELVIFDPALGRQEAQPAVQRIPGRGQPVQALLRDGLTKESWPKFLHPWPLDAETFLVACRPSPRHGWGLYLADVHDNLVLLVEARDHALLEPIPLQARARPPVLPSRIQPGRTDAVVVLQDIYSGDGLRGVPRGTVKALRLFTYHYAYPGMGGLLGVVGMDGPWDMRRVIGTVPVEPDGSARFTIPANTPISLQPLDAEGKALQWMRSWLTAMPGETVQCTGCHDRANATPPPRPALALARPPSAPAPWYGPERGFSYAREVQPVIDHHCLPCHDGSPRPGGTAPPNLRGDQMLTDWKSNTAGNGGYAGNAGKFSVGYAELQRWVRRPGIESDYHVLEPLDFHVDTTHLFQLLRKGHYGVALETEAWDRLITWVDLNAPYHGTWSEKLKDPGAHGRRRRELLKTYANVEGDPEAPPPPDAPTYQPARPPPRALPAPPDPAPAVRVAGWPFDAEEAARRQRAAGTPTTREIELAPGVSLRLVRVPAGAFILGDAQGSPDEHPVGETRIDSPFWMGALEVSNAQYACFDPAHDSRVESKNAYQFGVHGYPLNQPEQPVVRVSWREAMAFCAWLGARAELEVSLPTEAQWEWACRAGAGTRFGFGPADADFSAHANLADAALRAFASDPYTVDKPIPNATPYDDWLPKDVRFRDGAVLTVPGGRYRANAWGLHDLHGNVAEWTRSLYRPYPHRDDGRDDPEAAGRRVVRGGSWRDPPAFASAARRLDFEPWQRVYNVGFRVVATDRSPPVQARTRQAPAHWVELACPAQPR